MKKPNKDSLMLTPSLKTKLNGRTRFPRFDLGFCPGYTKLVGGIVPFLWLFLWGFSILSPSVFADGLLLPHEAFAKTCEEVVRGSRGGRARLQTVFKAKKDLRHTTARIWQALEELVGFIIRNRKMIETQGYRIQVSGQVALRQDGGRLSIQNQDGRTLVEFEGAVFELRGRRMNRSAFLRVSSSHIKGTLHLRIRVRPRTGSSSEVSFRGQSRQPDKIQRRLRDQALRGSLEDGLAFRPLRFWTGASFREAIEAGEEMLEEFEEHQEQGEDVATRFFRLLDSLARMNAPESPPNPLRDFAIAGAIMRSGLIRQTPN